MQYVIDDWFAVINIALILTPTAFGGAEKVGLTLLSNIDREQFNIVPITLIRPWEVLNPFVDAARAAGIRCYSIPVARKPRDQGRDYFRVLRCVARCRAMLQQLQISLVHTNGYFADLIGIPAAKSLKIQSMATCHGFIQGDRKLRLYNWADKKVLRIADHIAAVSGNIQETLIQSGVARKRIEVIPNAVQEQMNSEKKSVWRQKLRKSLHYADQDIVLGYLGRMSEEKGLLYLIEAAGMLVKEGMRVKLLMVGDGPQRDLLEEASKRIGVRAFCTFTGFKAQAEVFLSAMDIFVLPSLSEGTPMALLEAMANGVPVIASAVGGVPDIIRHDQNGLLMEPAQPEQILRAVKGLRGNNAHAQAIARNARQTIAERFSIKHWIDRYHALYRNLVPLTVRRGQNAFVLSK